MELAVLAVENVLCDHGLLVLSAGDKTATGEWFRLVDMLAVDYILRTLDLLADDDPNNTAHSRLTTSLFICKGSEKFMRSPILAGAWSSLVVRHWWILDS